MKKTIIILIFGALTVFSSVGANCASRQISVLTENSGDNNYLAKDGSIKGHNVDIVREIMARLGVGGPVELMPWKRAYLMARSGPNVALFSTTRTFAREDLFKWVGPLHVSRFVLYGKKGSGIEVNSLADAKTVGGIGCYRDDVREQYLKANGFKNLESLYGSDANAINLRKLLAGRIDLWITSNKVMINTARNMGIDSEGLTEVFVVKKVYAYIAFSKTTPDAIVSQWQTTLDDIKRDGSYERIMARYPTGMDSITHEPPRPAEKD